MTTTDYQSDYWCITNLDTYISNDTLLFLQALMRVILKDSMLSKNSLVTAPNMKKSL